MSNCKNNIKPTSVTYGDTLQSEGLKFFVEENLDSPFGYEYLQW